MPAGGFVHASGSVDPVPSHVYAAGSVPPFVAALLVSVKVPLELPAVGVTETPLDAAPAPSVFVAVTVQLYVVPFVRPVTVIGLPVPVAVTETPFATQVTV